MHSDGMERFEPAFSALAADRSSHSHTVGLYHTCQVKAESVSFTEFRTNISNKSWANFRIERVNLVGTWATIFFSIFSKLNFKLN